MPPAQRYLVIQNSKEVTYWKYLEEVDLGEMAFLAFVVRWQRNRHVFQVLGEQNYEEDGPKVAQK